MKKNTIFDKIATSKDQKNIITQYLVENKLFNTALQLVWQAKVYTVEDRHQNFNSCNCKFNPDYKRYITREE